MALVIGSGILRGMKIHPLPGNEITRPTSSKVRAAVINMLRQRLVGACVLDLCAGSGAMGIEFLSNGATSATLVEADRKASNLLRSNILEANRRMKSQNMPVESVEVIETDIFNSWNILAKFSPFQIVWADPPYKHVQSWVQLIADALLRLTEQGSIFVLECDKSGKEAAIAICEGHNWTLFKDKSYGETYILMFERHVNG